MNLLQKISPPHRLYLLCLHLAIGASLWGYNIGILSSLLVHPGFQSAVHPSLTTTHHGHQPASQSVIHANGTHESAGGGGLTPSQKGSITAIYYLGTLPSYLLLSHPLADWLGRRGACAAGTALLLLGATVMASAGGMGAVLAGRWLGGLGVGVVSTGVPLYQSEVAPARERGKFVTMNHVGFVAGLAAGMWVGYGMSFWKSEAGTYWGWRLSVLIQLVPACLFLLGLPFAPESPRWLVEHNQPEAALRTLTLIDPSPSTTLHSITRSSYPQGSTSFLTTTRTLLTDPSLSSRLLRAFTLQLLAQLCGATAMKYYLPTLLSELGIPEQTALMAGAWEMTIKIFLTVVEMWIIDRVGRRWCLMGGGVVMAVAMGVNAALPVVFGKGNGVVNVVCVVFIFVYAMGYSLGLGPAAWVYSSEIFPTSYRARGLNFAASGGAVGSILVAQAWPVGLAKLGSGIYFVFMAVNLACVPIIWFFYPETKGRALEDMDELFGRVKTDASIFTLDDAEGEGNEEGIHRDRIGEGEEGSDAEEDAPLLS